MYFVLFSASLEKDNHNHSENLGLPLNDLVKKSGHSQDNQEE